RSCCPARGRCRSRTEACATRPSSPPAKTGPTSDPRCSDHARFPLRFPELHGQPNEPFTCVVKARSDDHVRLFSAVPETAPRANGGPVALAQLLASSRYWNRPDILVLKQAKNPARRGACP